MVEREEVFVNKVLCTLVDDGSYYYMPSHRDRWVGSGYVEICPVTSWKGRIVRRLLKWLKKKGLLAWRDYKVSEPTLQKVTINFREIDKAISQSTRSVERICARRVNTLIVGKPEFQHLRDIVETQMPLGFVSSIRTGNGERLEYHGMKLVIVPWFNGILPIYLESEDR